MSKMCVNRRIAYSRNIFLNIELLLYDNERKKNKKYVLNELINDNNKAI